MQTNIYSIYFILTLLTKSKGFFSVLSAVFNPLFAQWPAGLSLRPHSHKQRTSSVNKAQRPFYGAAPPPPPLTRNAEILARKFLQLPSALAFHSSISIQLPPRAIAFAIEFALVLLLNTDFSKATGELVGYFSCVRVYLGRKKWRQNGETHGQL